MTKNDSAGLEQIAATALPVSDAPKPGSYSGAYRSILENNKSLVFRPASNDNPSIGEPRQGVKGSMFEEFLAAIKGREGSRLSEKEMETRAWLLADVYDVLPYGRAAIERDLKLLREKRAAASETFGKLETELRVQRKDRSVALDVEVQDIARVRAARRRLREFERYPERFQTCDAESIRADRSLVQGYNRRLRAAKAPGVDT